MPQAAPIIGAAVGGVSLLDNMFGSGKDSRNQQDAALALQQQLANAQLPDIQRRSGLNQDLQNYLMGILNQSNEGAELPGQYLDLSSFGATGGGPDLYNEIGPGVQRMNALKMLFGLGGNTGTGGIMSNAQMATGLNQQNRSEFGNTVQGIIETLAKQDFMRGSGDSSAPPPVPIVSPSGVIVTPTGPQIPTF